MPPLPSDANNLAFSLARARPQVAAGVLNTLGQTYLPNFTQSARIARFQTLHPDPAQDAVDKYVLAMRDYYANAQIIQKWLTMDYDSEAGVFVLAIDDLVNAKELSVTLLAATDLAAGTNVSDLQQPVYSYDRTNGVLRVQPASAEYANYENVFGLTASVFNNLRLVYALVYNTGTSSAASAVSAGG